MGLFSQYFAAAMLLAEYVEMEENEGWFGSIPACPGLWASAPTKAECEVELRSNLEEWVLFGLTHSIEIPPVGGVNLNLSTAEVTEVLG